MEITHFNSPYETYGYCKHGCGTIVLYREVNHENEDACFECPTCPHGLEFATIDEIEEFALIEP